MNKPLNNDGTCVSHFDPPADFKRVLDLGLILGQRRALVAVGGRCSAAHAQILRRVRDEKLYRAVAPSWSAFCGAHLPLSRRHADRLIALLNRFGAPYFELSELMGISPAQYLAIEPAVREDCLVVDGEAISLIPANAPRIKEAVELLLARASKAPLPPQSTAARIAELTARGRAIANQLVALYESSRSSGDRELIVEAATGLRLILMQPGIDSPPYPEGGLTRA
jgi:hypothetical protein